MNNILAHITSKDGIYWMIYYFLVMLDRYIHVNDKLYLKLYYRCNVGHKLNLKNPRTFTEKLQWLKLYNRKDIYTKMVDKNESKVLVGSKVGIQYIVPTIGVWDSPDEIDWSTLPNQFVLKCTHDSGTVILCKDKQSLDIDAISKRLCKSLNYSYFDEGGGREWPYKNVPHKIIAEEMLVDNKTGDLKDYKFFCFNGKVKFFKIDFGRFVEHHANYYDINGKFLDMGEVAYRGDSSVKLDIPKNLKEMIDISEKLSEGIPFVRVDLYNCEGRIYFGELTLFPAGGSNKMYPETCDAEWGKLITLPTRN